MDGLVPEMLQPGLSPVRVALGPSPFKNPNTPSFWKNRRREKGRVKQKKKLRQPTSGDRDEHNIEKAEEICQR